MQGRMRLRDLPAIPLLYLLHLIFTLSSLLLRLYEAVRASISSDTSDADHTAPSSAPRHLALVLSIPSGPKTGQRTSSSSRGQAALRDAALQSVRRAVQWAQATGIEHLSVYNADGLLQSLVVELRAEYQPLPPSPPSSTGSPSLPPQSHPYLSSPPDSADDEESQETEAGQLRSRTRLAKSSGTDGRSQVVSLRCRGHLNLHILPSGPDVADLIPFIAREMARAGMTVSEITQQRIDAEMQDRLHSPAPDLLIVHPLQPLSLWQSLLPRAAPELHGYPFWPLRITEIYQHPPPLPLHYLEPLFSAARRSTLPFVRKLGSLVRSEREGETADSSTGVKLYRAGRRIPHGTLRRDEWDGAMQAWGRVEQRLGK